MHSFGYMFRFIKSSSGQYPLYEGTLNLW